MKPSLETFVFPKRSLHLAAVILAAAATLSLASCSHAKPQADTDASSDAAAASTDIRSSDLGNAYGLETVHFAYDSSLLDKQAKRMLRENASVLKKNPALRIQIEGHCDQRGGIQYNIALGERRATTVKHYLVDLGVHDGQLTTISYGKERLLDHDDTEEAYAKNRRACFTVTQALM